VGELEQASHALSKVLYESGQAQAARGGRRPTPRPPSGSCRRRAIDAEFEVKE
jgi:hypothetical protein